MTKKNLVSLKSWRRNANHAKFIQPRTQASALSRPGPATSKLCLGLVPLVSETGQHHPHASASAAAGGEIGGLRGPWIGRAEQDAARSHNSSYIETQYLFCMVNMDELCHIHQSCGLTYVLRDLMRACGRMPACVWEQYAVKRAGWMVMQMAASSRCEMHGACVTADR